VSVTAASQLLRVVLLTLLGLVLVLAGSVVTAAAGVGEKRDPPALLWKTYPLKERAKARDATTISRAHGVLGARTAEGHLARNPAGPRSLLALVSLGLATLLLGVATLPELVFPDRRVAHLLARRRLEVTVAGAALLLASIIAFALG
jgi:hypothetical protein